MTNQPTNQPTKFYKLQANITMGYNSGDNQYEESRGKRRFSKYEEDQQGQEHEEQEEEQPNKKFRSNFFEVIIKNLSFEVDENQLQEFFSECGDIEQISLPKKDNGYSRGFGFIKFTSQKGVDEAMKLNATELLGRQIVVALSTKAGGNNNHQDSNGEEKHNIFIGNLAFETTEESLSNLFEECGKIIGIRIPTNPQTGRKKGFAFVDFESADAVEKAMAMNDYELDGRNIRVDRGGSKKQDRGFRGGRDGGFRGGRSFRGGRDGGFRGSRDDGFRGGNRDGGYRGSRDGGYRSNRDSAPTFQGKHKTF